MDRKYLVQKWKQFLPPKNTKNVQVLYKFAKVFENTVLENLNKNHSKILLSILYKLFKKDLEFELSKSTKNQVFIGSFPEQEMIDHNSIMIDFAIIHIESTYKTLLDKISSGEITKISSLSIKNNNKEYSIYVNF